MNTDALLFDAPSVQNQSHSSADFRSQTKAIAAGLREKVDELELRSKQAVGYLPLLIAAASCSWFVYSAQAERRDEKQVIEARYGKLIRYNSSVMYRE